jgi:hypothetical protein
MDETNLARKAYSLLFDDGQEYFFRLKYTGRVKDFGGRVSKSGRYLEFTLSKKWIGVSEDIQIGLMHELIQKILRKRKDSLYADLYSNFVKNLHLVVPKNKTDPVLRESFDRVNDRYFLGLVEEVNLQWGRVSRRTFGTYDFKSDTITMSQVFKETDPIYLDYVMFHEMLHKQRKFVKSGSKTFYHDSKFRKAEAIFDDAENLEKSIGYEVKRVMAGKKVGKTSRQGFFSFLR